MDDPPLPPNIVEGDVKWDGGGGGLMGLWPLVASCKLGCKYRGVGGGKTVVCGVFRFITPTRPIGGTGAKLPTVVFTYRWEF